MKVKIRDIGFEFDPAEGTATVIQGEDLQKRTIYGNAVEAWNAFAELALRPFEKALRDELEAHGYNRWTGIKNDMPTETELKLMDEHQAIRR